MAKKKSYRDRIVELNERIYDYSLDPIKQATYDELKSKYNINTYDIEELVSNGADVRGLYKYYKREEQLYTGEYETIRVKQAFKNYQTMLDNATSNKDLKDLMKDIIKNIPMSKRKDVFDNNITLFPVYYTLKKVGGAVVDSEIEDNIREILERQDLFSENVRIKLQDKYDEYVTDKSGYGEYLESDELIFTDDEDYEW